MTICSKSIDIATDLSSPRPEEGLLTHFDVGWITSLLPVVFFAYHNRPRFSKTVEFLLG